VFLAIIHTCCLDPYAPIQLSLRSVPFDSDQHISIIGLCGIRAVALSFAVHIARLLVLSQSDKPRVPQMIDLRFILHLFMSSMAHWWITIR
jgi:hypothetical protein